jgi:hypothetical protein
MAPCEAFTCLKVCRDRFLKYEKSVHIEGDTKSGGRLHHSQETGSAAFPWILRTSPPALSPRRPCNFCRSKPNDRVHKRLVWAVRHVASTRLIRIFVIEAMFTGRMSARPFFHACAKGRFSRSTTQDDLGTPFRRILRALSKPFLDSKSSDFVSG